MTDMIQNVAAKHGLAIDSDVAGLLAQQAVVALGVSGGKDSDAMALAVNRFLDAAGHTGQRVLVHSDLGQIEHSDSLPQCRRLAEMMELELIIVGRRQGGMIERWEQRWRDNAARYTNLECVTLITPWSSAGMRFCTSELKVTPICRELSQRFHGQPIINAVGIRREESPGRAKKPISQPNAKLMRAGGKAGRDWYPILEWSVEQVWLEHQRCAFEPHYAYRHNGNSRVSCSVCVLSSLHDLQASLKDERNHAAYLRVVNLEINSAFSFQPSRWLGDVRSDLLNDVQREGLQRAKEINSRRREIEARIPKELRFVSGWPTFVPDDVQSSLLAEVREEIGHLTGLPVRYTSATAIRERYRELVNLRDLKRAP